MQWNFAAAVSRLDGKGLDTKGKFQPSHHCLIQGKDKVKKIEILDFKVESQQMAIVLS
jgi:hypothetical protein